MDEDVERALRALRAAEEFTARYRFELTDEYLALLAEVEALPQNQAGADKSGTWKGLRAFRDSFWARRGPRPGPVTEPLLPLVRALAARRVRYVLIVASLARTSTRLLP